MTGGLVEYNRALRARVEELEETIRQLTAQEEADTRLPDDLPPLRPSEAIIMRALLRRRLMSKWDVYFVLYGDYEDRRMKTVDVWICLLRKKLAGTRYRIETVWGRGVRLVEVQATASVSPIINISHTRQAVS